MTPQCRSPIDSRLPRAESQHSQPRPLQPLDAPVFDPGCADLRQFSLHDRPKFNNPFSLPSFAPYPSHRKRQSIDPNTPYGNPCSQDLGNGGQSNNTLLQLLATFRIGAPHRRKSSKQHSPPPTSSQHFRTHVSAERTTQPSYSQPTGLLEPRQVHTRQFHNSSTHLQRTDRAAPTAPRSKTRARVQPPHCINYSKLRQQNTHPDDLGGLPGRQIRYRPLIFALPIPRSTGCKVRCANSATPKSPQRFWYLSL